MDYSFKFVHNSGGPITLSEEVCSQLCQMSTELVVLERELSDFKWENCNEPTLPIKMDELMSEGQYEGGEGLVIMEELNTNKVLGFFKFVPGETTVTIFYFVIDKDHRGSGLGTALIEEGKRYLKTLGFEEILLYYKKKNLPGVEKKKKNGFPPVVIMGSCKL